MAQRTLLLVDDDRALASILATALEEEGYEVRLAHDGAAGLEAFEQAPADVVVLDVLMPEMDGLEVCRRLRARSEVPIVLLTSRGEEVDRVTGLDSGADDYVSKPFSTRELCARLRALERRVKARAAGAPGEGPVPPPRGPLSLARLPPHAIRVGPLEVDPARFCVRWGGRPVALTRSELALLATLARHRGFVLGRDQLLDLARGDDAVVTERTVDTFVKRIRKKLREVDPAFEQLETVIGVGYRWKAD